MDDVLGIIWSFWDEPVISLSACEISGWPIGTFEQFAQLGFLRQAPAARHAACPDCSDRHVEEVITYGGSFRIPCPGNLYVDVPRREVECWAIDFDAVARAIAEQLIETGRFTPLLSGRLWRLGRVNWRGANRDVLLTRGLFWPDGMQLVERIGGTGQAIVLVARQVPVRRFWPELPPPVIELGQVARLGAGKLEVALQAIAPAIDAVDTANRLLQPVALTQEEQERQFRSVAAKIFRSASRGEEFVNAYVEHGSYRKAAAALTQSLGYGVSKEAVKQAVDDAGGIGAVRSGTNSDSIKRTVASQRRDRRKKSASAVQVPEIE